MNSQEVEALLLKLAQDIRAGCRRSRFGQGAMFHQVDESGNFTCQACVMGAAVLGRFADTPVVELRDEYYWSDPETSLSTEDEAMDHFVMVFHTEMIYIPSPLYYDDVPLHRWLLEVNDMLLAEAKDLDLIAGDPRLLIADTLEKIVREKAYSKPGVAFPKRVT